MRKWLGSISIVLGALCLLSAIGFMLYNRWEASNAAQTSQALLEEVQQVVQKDKIPTQETPDPESTIPTEAPTVPTEMPTEAPTEAPTTPPTVAPTEAPAPAPTEAPAPAPTQAPAAPEAPDDSGAEG